MNKVNELKYKNVNKHQIIRFNDVEFNIPFNESVVFKHAAVSRDGCAWLYSKIPTAIKGVTWAATVDCEIIPVGTVNDFGDWEEAIFDVEYV